MTSTVHAAAAKGFGRAADDYERGRPGYPPAAIEHLRQTLALGPGRRVLDLAAGTGKLTRALVGTGAEVIAVEPVAGMRAKLVDAVPQTTVRDGTAEAIPLPDGSVDAVCVAQAFHWFDAPAAALEIRRVLVPGGGLAVIWNAWDEDVPWVAAMLEIIHAHADDAPQQRTSSWPRELAGTGAFSPLQEVSFANLVPGDRDALLARVASTSYIAALPDEAREAVRRNVLAVVDHDPETAQTAALTMPYTTHVVSCRRV